MMTSITSIGVKPASGDVDDDADGAPPRGPGVASCTTPGALPLGWAFWASSSSLERRGADTVAAPEKNARKGGAQPRVGYSLVDLPSTALPDPRDAFRTRGYSLRAQRKPTLGPDSMAEPQSRVVVRLSAG